MFLDHCSLVPSQPVLAGSIHIVDHLCERTLSCLFQDVEGLLLVVAEGHQKDKLPLRKDNPSQTVLVSFADKTEPMAFNYYATGAYLLPRFNTGLVIAASKMKHGYIMEIVDLDTKAQAIEAGAHPRDQKALDGKMEELAKGLQEKVNRLRAHES